MWAWANWAKVSEMANPVGYLYRVGQSRSRRPKTPPLPPPAAVGLPDVEPKLVPSLMSLSKRQRAAVWLVCGCEWTHEEAGVAMGISRTAVGTHVARGLARLRTLMEGK